MADNVVTTRDLKPDVLLRHKWTLLISATIFVIAILLVHLPRQFDMPVERLINDGAAKSAFVDDLFFDLDTYFSLSGAILVALVWACWFGNADLEMRTRLLVGTLVSLVAGAISRFLQHSLSSHPRPLYDQAFDFHAPLVANQTPLNTWDSFPSDHAAVFCGLALVIFLARPRLGLAAAAWLGLFELSRAYMGVHYPTDLVGGAALGAFIVSLGQAPAAVSWGKRVVRRERSSPALFYMGAFFISYQIATLVQDFRSMAGGVHLIYEIKRAIAYH